MAALTPIANTRFDSVIGDQRAIDAKFASVADGDTWVTGLSLITSIDITSGSTTPKAMSGSASNGTVTIRVTSGPDTNTYVNVSGY
jgi:hypothetical protein